MSSLGPTQLRQREDYMIFAGDSFDRYLADLGRYGRQARKYRRLFREFELVKAFDDPHRGAQILIYRMHSGAGKPGNG